MTATPLSDHDLTQALFQSALARQTTETLEQMRAMLSRTANDRARAAIPLVEAELQRRRVDARQQEPDS